MFCRMGEGAVSSPAQGRCCNSTFLRMISCHFRGFSVFRLSDLKSIASSTMPCSSTDLKINSSAIPLHSHTDFATPLTSKWGLHNIPLRV